MPDPATAESPESPAGGTPPHFLLDEDLNPVTAEIGRRLGLDVVSVHEIDRRGFSDEEQLRFAIGQRWTFVIRNRDDFLASPPPSSRRERSTTVF